LDTSFAFIFFANLFINILKTLSLLKRDENFFLEKSSEGVLKSIVEQKKHAMRRELLRLQKTSFFEATSSSRGGIYYKCFLKIVTKFGAGSLPIVLQ